MGNKNACFCCTKTPEKGQKIKYSQTLLQYDLKPILKQNKKQQISPENHQLYPNDHAMVPDVKIWIKVPCENEVFTKFKWIQQQKWKYPSSIIQFKHEVIFKRSFQEKVAWFQLKLDERKVSWKEGCENIKVDRLNILNSSLQQLQKLNITKQVKVNFTDESGQNDAGGIFREWLHMCMKEIFQNNHGLFSLCQTDSTYYKLNINQKNAELCSNIASLLGCLIAKALMEKVPINCHLNHTIWRQILHQRITLDDMFTYDQQLYFGWKYVLQNEGACQDLNFTTLMYDKYIKKHKMIALVPNGKQINVTQENKAKFIQKMILTYSTYKSIAKSICLIKKVLYQIIPCQYLSVFQPYEIDSLLCGQQSIDLNDWKQNTVYQGYVETDDVISWFWKLLGQLEAGMLKNLLHYCTGCSRIPVTGFKFLESNRGKVTRFTIKKIHLDQFNPYPRSYTCFNRLELPNYVSQDQLSTMIYSICTEEINQINIDA